MERQRNGNGTRRNAKENGAKEHAWISRTTGEPTGRQADSLTKKTLRYAPGLRGISFASGGHKGVSPAMPGTQQTVRQAGKQRLSVQRIFINKYLQAYKLISWQQELQLQWPSSVHVPVPVPVCLGVRFVFGFCVSLSVTTQNAIPTKMARHLNRHTLCTFWRPSKDVRGCFGREGGLGQTNTTSSAHWLPVNIANCWCCCCVFAFAAF